MQTSVLVFDSFVVIHVDQLDKSLQQVHPLMATGELGNILSEILNVTRYYSELEYLRRDP